MISISYSILDLIKRQKAEFQSFKTLSYTSRVKESQLRKYLQSSLIKVVMGPRRAGKSRLIQKVLEDQNIAYINFEEEQFRSTSGQQIIDAAQEIYPEAKYWYLDEVQDFPDWESLLNKLHRRQFNLIVTGSNSNLLSTELASALTGRHLPLELLPFSYGEYLTATQKDRGWTSYEAYLRSGGFPEVVLSGIDSRTYLSTLFDSIVLKDLVRRKKIRNPSYLSNCISLMMNNVAARTSARALAKALKNEPSATTVEKYIDMCREAYLIESIGSYHSKTKSRIQSERKPYAIDTGFLEAKSRQVMPLIGKQLENSIYLELRREGHSPAGEIYYYRGDDGIEVDFLIRDGFETVGLVQVCLDMSALETRDREVRALISAKKEHTNALMTIVTGNESGSIVVSKNDVIKVVPAHEFCS